MEQLKLFDFLDDEIEQFEFLLFDRIEKIKQTITPERERERVIFHFLVVKIALYCTI